MQKVARMMCRFAVISALSMGSVSVAEDLKTNDGKSFRQFKVVQIDPNGIFIRHSKGMAKLHFDDLSEAMKERFGYDSGAAGRFEREHVEEEPPARPAPPPGGFKEVEGAKGGGITYGPIIASVQYNVVPIRSQCGLYPDSHLEWRRRSLCDLMAATYGHRTNYVAPWQWGGYAYGIFRR